MSYPASKTRTPSRRKLGRGQVTAAAYVSLVVTGSGSTVTLTFSRPIVVTGPIVGTVATRTFVSQVITSPTVVTQTWSSAVTGLAYAFSGPQANAASYQGGQVAGATGTFP